jgi:plastocyanin
MKRAMLLCVIVGAAAFASGGTALAGGGCHEGVTQDDATGEDEATVRMFNACFEATVTTVDPGTPVTFVNDDIGVTHNVGGNQWGHFDDMIEGDAFTATFDDPGVYPFACNYHPGMTGAIVVGGGKGGAGSGEDVSIQPFEPAPKGVAPAADERDGVSTAGVLGIGLLSAGLGVAIALGIGRMRRMQPLG